ncbi:MAG: 5'/3'-nucleotidase SurE [Pseudopedobacter saltans]|uniref:5'-nucleotidase SurE n=1 Tax=Pseudopedobacter saltans TaxID=151895 RepID=A0A2W5F273_9SPHI|nr:MAG: 5'/3'-nucleotidase SurE [Pseudopedobacter saltans]
MNILITNDDGIYSPGIKALAEVARKFGKVKVVAPDVEQSSMGHAITHGRPLAYKKSQISFGEIDAYRVNGTPADSVALGVHINAKTDVVLSGINLGPNLGNSMWHSGTLAAARQAVLLGIKGIALSVNTSGQEPNFQLLSKHIENVLAMLLEDKRIGLYNVNFPEKPNGEIKWTKQSVRLYDGKVLPGVDPTGKKFYWISVSALSPSEEGTDRWAVENDYISITPLQLDLSDMDELKKRILL